MRMMAWRRRRVCISGREREPDDIEAFRHHAGGSVDRTDPVKSLLNQQADQPPASHWRRSDSAGTFDEQALTDWVRHLAGAARSRGRRCPRAARGKRHLAAPSQLLRRLTHSQYNNTVRDLLGDFSRPADRFPPEDFVNGFKNQLRTQGMPPLLAEAYSAAAGTRGGQNPATN